MENEKAYRCVRTGFLVYFLRFRRNAKVNIEFSHLFLWKFARSALTILNYLAQYGRHINYFHWKQIQLLLQEILADLLCRRNILSCRLPSICSRAAAPFIRLWTRAIFQCKTKKTRKKISSIHWICVYTLRWTFSPQYRTNEKLRFPIGSPQFACNFRSTIFRCEHFQVNAATCEIMYQQIAYSTSDDDECRLSLLCARKSRMLSIVNSISYDQYLYKCGSRSKKTTHTHSTKCWLFCTRIQSNEIEQNVFCWCVAVPQLSPTNLLNGFHFEIWRWWKAVAWLAVLFLFLSLCFSVDFSRFWLVACSICAKNQIQFLVWVGGEKILSSAFYFISIAVRVNSGYLFPCFFSHYFTIWRLLFKLTSS